MNEKLKKARRKRKHKEIHESEINESNLKREKNK